jgi:hypothetical protein
VSFHWKRGASSLGLAMFFLSGCQKTELAGTGAAQPAATVAPSTSAQAATGASAPVIDAAKPPFGVLHVPKEGETVKPGSWAFGWALDDSGIAQITVVADGGGVIAVALNQPFPGVAQSYPGYANADKAGFGFAIPKLPSGTHALTITLVGKDGGKTELHRQVRIQ